MDENRKKVSRFFPIESLHYCAAVRYVLVPGSSTNGTSSNNNTLNRSSTASTADKSAQPRFLPLDSPFARNPNINHPPLFAAILRRTSGIKVLECHVFICKRETAANALVRYVRRNRCLHFAVANVALRWIFLLYHGRLGLMRKDYIWTKVARPTSMVCTVGPRVVLVFSYSSESW